MASMRVALTLAALMCTASAVAYFARPSASAADRTPKVQLDAAIPKQFGQWREEPTQTVAVVNPQTRFEHRLAEIRLGLTGQVPYGLLFRVSSIDGDADRAYREHDRFVGELLAAVSAADRMRLIRIRVRSHKLPFGLSLSKPFDKLRANGVFYTFDRTSV